MRHVARLDRTGLEGKPYFISGPYDNVRKIMQQLDRKVGAGNYTFTAGGTLDELPPELLALVDDPDAFA